MVPQWFIEEKRDGREHDEADLREWVRGVAEGTLPDYQIAAWLMAAYLNGLSPRETAVLTDAMMRSGDCLEWDDLPRPTADKHSTGGVGDKISLPLAPLCAALGLAVPMISGRGLGLTGGTLDKLESIPGFNVRLGVADFRRIVAEAGCCMIGQTDRLAPADRRLYALRDVTATVPSIPLIVASIMSKKLAEGAQTLLFDVKFGSGAFMRTPERARALAEALIATGRHLGRNCRALLTDMDQPLGRTVGNALEVREALDVLRGGGPRDVRHLTVEEAAHMAHAAGRFPSLAEARAAAERALGNGAALERFRAMSAAQGGDLDAPLPEATARLEVPAPRAGWVTHVSAETMGRVALRLGAGRQAAEETPDLAAGVDAIRQQGERVEAGAPLCVLCAASPERARALADDARAAFTLADTPPPERQLIREVLQ